MIKTKSFYIAIIIVGACLFVAAILSSLMFEMPKSVAGVCLGIGTALLGIGIPKLIMKYCETTQPELMKQNQIEFHDERNTMIRNNAKAKASDIIQWFIMGIAYVAILVESPQWVIFAVVGVYLLKNILELVFTIKYQKEL
jgi:hypothetical protein